MTAPNDQPLAGGGRTPAGAITSGEWRWVIAASLAVMAFTCVPYLFGWYITPPGFRYMGLLANPDEHNVYLGWMRQAQRGQFLFVDPFTTEPQQAGFFHGFFLALGLTARMTHLPPVWVYHLARLICGALLLGAVYALAAQVFAERFTRRLAWALAAFSSGLGWLYTLVNPAAAVHPIDFGPGLVMPEAITFLSLLLNPLFCFSVFLMVALFAGYLAAVRTNSWRPAVAAGIAAFILGNVHTYDVFVVWATLAAHVVATGIIGRRLPGREAGFAALIGAMATPFVIYQCWLFQVNPVFRDKALTPTLTPPTGWVIAGFGLVAALALAGAVVALLRRSAPQALLIVWVAVTFLLAFLAPVSFQRKLMEGVHVPLCLLAALFVGGWAGRMKPRTALVAAAVLVLATAPSNLFFVGRGLRDLVHNNAAYLKVLMPPLYLPSDTVEAMLWLRDNTRMDQAVLCMPRVGSYVPGVAGNTVFVGHWAETLHYRHKLAEVRWFFSGRPTGRDLAPKARKLQRLVRLRRVARIARTEVRAPEAARRAWMTQNGLQFVLYTPEEAALGPFDPRASREFAPVFEKPHAAVLQLTGGDHAQP